MASMNRQQDFGRPAMKMMSYSDGTANSSSGGSQRSGNENVTNFQNAMRMLLGESDRDQMTDILGYYHRSRNVYHLMTSLENVLDTAVKQKLIPILRKVLPRRDRPVFDRYMSQGVYSRKQSPSRENGFHQGTDNSGIRSNTATTQSSHAAPALDKCKKKSKSQYISNDSHKRESSQSSSNISISFGSAVRRKVKAAMEQRGLNKTHNGPLPKRRHSIGGTLDIPEYTDASEGASRTMPRTRHGISPYWPKDAYDDVKIVFLNKSNRHEPMGFSIRGGAEHGLGIYVSHVEMGSAADESGLLLGDQILRVNNKPFLADATHDMAANVLAEAYGKVVMYVRSVGQVPDAIVTSRNFAWTDIDGRPTSPPPDVAFLPSGSSNMHKSDLKLMLTDERRVNLTVAPGRSLGLIIRGGLEYGLGIYITGVDPNSASEQAGLKAGDQIMEVNNISFKNITHADAVNMIRSSRMLMMMVRHVGRIPQCHVSREETRWMTDDQISYHSKRMSRNWSLPRRPGGSLGAFQRGLAGSGQVTLRHAQSTTSLSLTSLERALFHAMDKVEEPGLLSDEELMTLRYYVSEYNLGNVSVDALVLSLSQLLRSQTKLSLLSAVRKCVFNRDLDRFDVLVLRREVEALKKEHEIEKSTIHEVDENHKNDTNLHKRDCDRQHSRKNSALKSRSSSVPPIRSTMLNATVEEHLYLENTSYNNSGDAHLSPPNASSTPNDSGEQATRERLPPPPPVPAAVPTPQGGRRNQLKKTISPILKDDVELMTSSMKLVRPIKPKRSTLGKSYQEESRTNVSSWNPIYTETNESPMNMNMPNSSFTPNMIQYTSSSKNSTGSIGRLYPRKHEDAKVSFGSPPAQLDDADKHVRKTPSPFTKAIEKQSTLTKIKASKGNSHISLSGLDFFEAPQRNVAHLHMSSKRDHQTSKDLPKPTHSAPICVHRVHNNIHIMETLDSTNDSADDRPLPPPPMSLLRDQGPSSPPSHYPVKVDVHQASSFHGAPGYMDLPSDFKSTKISINVAPPTTSSDPSSIYTAVYNTNNSNRRSFSQEIDSDEYDQGIEYDDIINPYEYLKDAEKQKVIIFKVASTLGLSIEGGANTRQPLPRISSVQPGGCAHICGRLVSGHVVHQVNGIDMAGLEHPQITRTIASAFQSKDRDSLELLVSGPYRSKGNQ